MIQDERNREEMVPIATGPPSQLDTLALVLEAVDVEHYLEDGALLVPAAELAAARYHLDQYHLENSGWPTPSPPIPPLSSQAQPTLLAMALLAVFFLHTGPWAAQSVWFERGVVDNNAILHRGEWWRLLTGLTLHADLAHLFGNCCIGGLVIHLLGRMIGYGQAWLLLIATGATGNLCNIAFRHTPHLAVGFSTSVFGAIGLLTGLQLARPPNCSYKALLLPLGAGAGLLAFLGTEGVQTDLGAHFFGFAIGIAGGWLCRRTGLTDRLQAPKIQGVLFLLALALLILAWTCALH
jgi:rhomboid protease GluP